jgi:hypothetical protein
MDETLQQPATGRLSRYGGVGRDGGAFSDGVGGGMLGTEEHDAPGPASALRSAARNTRRSGAAVSASHPRLQGLAWPASGQAKVGDASMPA